MRRHALDISHNGNGIVEDVAIDVLQNVANGRALRLARYKKSVVDVAATMRRQAQDFAVEFELTRCCVGVGRRAHDQRLSG
jgi:hypothetical protein